MHRGIFSSLTDNDIYKTSRKRWYVELLFSRMYWYEHVSVEHELFPTRAAIVAELKKFKEELKSSLDKRFIYFIASRKRVRFNVNKRPRYQFLGHGLVLHLSIGAHKKDRKIVVPIIDDGTGQVSKPTVQITEEHITLIDNSGNSITYSVHDFLSRTGLDFGISSEIHYVGFTKNPNSRPINGSHSGLNDVLYSVPTENEDIFVFYNLFKVLSCSLNDDYNMNFVLANSMTDEVDVDTEGELIEKTLLLYFNASLQRRNKNKELLELRSNLRQLSERLNIESVSINYAFEKADPYFRFMSSQVPASWDHFLPILLLMGTLLLSRDRRSNANLAFRYNPAMRNAIMEFT